MSSRSYSDDEIEEVYYRLDEMLDSVNKNDSLILMRDFNAVVGRGKRGTLVILDFGKGIIEVID